MGGNEASAFGESAPGSLAHEGDEEQKVGEVLSRYADEAKEGNRDVPGVQGGSGDEC